MRALDDYFSKNEKEEISDLDKTLKQKTLIINELEHDKISLQDDVLNYKVRIQDLTKQIKELTKPNIKQEIKNYLNENYHRVILQYDKRWVIDHKNKPIPLLFPDFIRPNQTLKQAFINTKSLKGVWEHYIKYVHDNYAYHGIPDVWQLPIETFVLGAGDCDDATAFRVAVAKSLGLEKNFVLFMAVGEYITDSGDRIGHCFPVMIKKDEKHNEFDWWVLEATSNQYAPTHYPAPAHSKHYQIEYLTDGEDSWMIRGYQSYGGKVLERFDLKKTG